MMLPMVNTAGPVAPLGENRRLLIISEGFEARSLSWISAQKKDVLFSQSIICRYDPGRENRFEEIYDAVTTRTSAEPKVLSYNRFDPTPFESELERELEKEISLAKEIIIDISVMSKMLIMIILYALRLYPHQIRIIYSEPNTWSPSEKEYLEKKPQLNQGSLLSLSSIGVYNFARTPGLSSIAMQNSPSLLIAFTSSNGLLVNALVNELNPSLTCLINAKNYREPWREQAAIDIQKTLIEGFPLYSNTIYCFELLDYCSVFKTLAEIYQKNCYSKRIILSPTGGKVHTIACALIKNCCPDIHVEYPTPESYIFRTFSSDEVYSTHEIVFKNFKGTIQELAVQYNLNG